jgi:murein tripeptide amidase MpaA
MTSLFACFLLTLTLRVGLSSDTGSSSSKSDLFQRWWNEVSTEYPRYNETTFLIREMEKTFPDLVKLYTIGESVQGREMWVIQLSQNVSHERPLLRPPMKIVANMHGDETVGRALTLMLAVDILRKYDSGDPR